MKEMINATFDIRHILSFAREPKKKNLDRTLATCRYYYKIYSKDC